MKKNNPIFTIIFRSIKSRFVALVLLFFIFSCVNEETKRFNYKAFLEKITHSTYFQWVMMDKTTCNLNYNYIETSKDDLFGVWKDSILWVQNTDDTCLYGIDAINRDTYLEFLPPNKYVWKEIHKGNYLNFEDRGEFFVENLDEFTSLTLMLYPEGKTTIAIGDSSIGKSYFLSWENDTTFLLIPRLNDTLNAEIYSMRKLR
ncbi:MAG: hypothetical protein ACOZCO_01675 [Bacteroidota bacterium]